MKRGRKELPTPVIRDDVNEDAVRQSLETAAAIALTAEAFSAEAGEAHQAFGRLQMAQGFAAISRAAEIKLYAQIQELKLFKHLSIKRADGNSAVAESFQEFCDLTHRQGYKGVTEEIQYFRTLGYPIYEALKNLDLSRKHYRLLLKVPEEDRQKLLEGGAVDLTDPDAVREHIEELAEEITKAEKALAAEREEHEATREQIEAKNKKIDELDKKLTKRSKHQPWDEKIKEFTVGFHEVTNINEESILSYIAGIQEIQEYWDAAPKEQRSSVAHFIIDEVNHVLAAAAQLQNYVDAEISIHAGARAVPIKDSEE